MDANGIRREINEYVHRINAVAKLKKQGLILPSKVEIPEEFLNKQGELLIPDDMTLIPPEELGRYLSNFTALAAFYDAMVAMTDIDRTTAGRVKDFVEAKVLLELSKTNLGKGENRVTLLKAEREVNEFVVKAQDWADETDAIFRLASALLSGIERILFLISREITRRGNNIYQENREHKVNGAPKPHNWGGQNES